MEPKDGSKNKAILGRMLLETLDGALHSTSLVLYRRLLSTEPIRCEDCIVDSSTGMVVGYRYGMEPDAELLSKEHVDYEPSI